MTHDIDRLPQWRQQSANVGCKRSVIRTSWMAQEVWAVMEGPPEELSRETLVTPECPLLASSLPASTQHRLCSQAFSPDRQITCVQCELHWSASKFHQTRSERCFLRGLNNKTFVPTQCAGHDIDSAGTYLICRNIHGEFSPVMPEYQLAVIMRYEI